MKSNLGYFYCFKTDHNFIWSLNGIKRFFSNSCHFNYNIVIDMLMPETRLSLMYCVAEKTTAISYHQDSFIESQETFSSPQSMVDRLCVCKNNYLFL